MPFFPITFFKLLSFKDSGSSLAAKSNYLLSMFILFVFSAALTSWWFLETFCFLGFSEATLSSSFRIFFFFFPILVSFIASVLWNARSVAGSSEWWVGSLWSKKEVKKLPKSILLKCRSQGEDVPEAIIESKNQRSGAREHH